MVAGCFWLLQGNNSTRAADLFSEMQMPEDTVVLDETPDPYGAGWDLAVAHPLDEAQIRFPDGYDQSTFTTTTRREGRSCGGRGPGVPPPTPECSETAVAARIGPDPRGGDRRCTIYVDQSTDTIVVDEVEMLLADVGISCSGLD